MISALVNTINAISDVPSEEMVKLCRIAVPEKIQKGNAFILEGDLPRKFAFVGNGLFRYYYVTEKGTEFTKGFFPEGSFITSYTAMIKRRPSYYTVQALEDSDVLVIDYTRWQKLYEGSTCWMNFLFALVEKGYMKKEARERELLVLDAEERYRAFLREYPALEKRVKQHMIASYLGITPVALSRIRKAMFSQNVSVEKKIPLT